jgi:hypothetical protein
MRRFGFLIVAGLVALGCGGTTLDDAAQRRVERATDTLSAICWIGLVPPASRKDHRAASNALNVLIDEYRRTPDGRAELAEDDGLEEIKWPIETTANPKWVRPRVCDDLIRRARRALDE